jgi:hypothetical protein
MSYINPNQRTRAGRMSSKDVCCCDDEVDVYILAKFGKAKCLS